MRQKDAVSSSQSRKVFISLLLLLCPFGLLCCYFFHSPWFLIHKDVCWEHPISFEAPMDVAGRVPFLLRTLYRPLCLNRRKDSLLYIYTTQQTLINEERKKDGPSVYIYIPSMTLSCSSLRDQRSVILVYGVERREGVSHRVPFILVSAWRLSPLPVWETIESFLFTQIALLCP